MTLTTLATLRHKLEKAEKLLKEREELRRNDGGYVILFSGDTQEEIEAKRQAVLNGRDPEKYQLQELMFEECDDDFVLPGQGDTSTNKPQEPLSTGILEESRALKAMEFHRADAEQEKKDGLELKPPG